MWKYAGRVHSVIQMVVPNIIIAYVIWCHKYHASYYITLKSAFYADAEMHHSENYVIEYTQYSAQQVGLNK
jgi:hypothetical protein